MSIETLVAPLQKQFHYFHPSQLAHLNHSRIPHHIAIIPDGNRRWAKKHLASPQEGHREGADILMEVVKAAQELNVKILTFYSFSTENWVRSKEEINALMALFTTYLLQQQEEMIRNGIKFETIGNLTDLPSFLNQAIYETKQATQHCTKIQLVLALNYGARDELCRAFKTILEDYDKGQIKKEEINEAMITGYLDTANWKDPELLIRTSGELRLSNFLLWQSSYTEFYATPVLWPDFTPQDLLEAIIVYQNRERRWGGT